MNGHGNGFKKIEDNEEILEENNDDNDIQLDDDEINELNNNYEYTENNNNNEQISNQDDEIDDPNIIKASQSKIVDYLQSFSSSVLNFVCIFTIESLEEENNILENLINPFAKDHQHPPPQAIMPLFGINSFTTRLLEVYISNIFYNDKHNAVMKTRIFFLKNALFRERHFRDTFSIYLYTLFNKVNVVVQNTYFDNFNRMALIFVNQAHPQCKSFIDNFFGILETDLCDCIDLIYEKFLEYAMENKLSSNSTLDEIHLYDIKKDKLKLKMEEDQNNWDSPVEDYKTKKLNNLHKDCKMPLIKRINYIGKRKTDKIQEKYDISKNFKDFEKYLNYINYSNCEFVKLKSSDNNFTLDCLILGDIYLSVDKYRNKSEFIKQNKCNVGALENLIANISYKIDFYVKWGVLETQLVKLESVNDKENVILHIVVNSNFTENNSSSKNNYFEISKIESHFLIKANKQENDLESNSKSLRFNYNEHYFLFIDNFNFLFNPYIDKESLNSIKDGGIKLRNKFKICSNNNIDALGETSGNLKESNSDDNNISLKINKSEDILYEDYYTIKKELSSSIEKCEDKILFDYLKHLYTLGKKTCILSYYNLENYCISKQCFPLLIDNENFIYSERIYSIIKQQCDLRKINCELRNEILEFRFKKQENDLFCVNDDYKYDPLNCFNKIEKNLFNTFVIVENTKKISDHKIENYLKDSNVIRSGVELYLSKKRLGENVKNISLNKKNSSSLNNNEIDNYPLNSLSLIEKLNEEEDYLTDSLNAGTYENLEYFSNLESSFKDIELKYMYSQRLLPHLILKVKISQFSVGINFYAFLDQFSRLFTAGYNDYGQLALGIDDVEFYCNKPTQVLKINDPNKVLNEKMNRLIFFDDSVVNLYIQILKIECSHNTIFVSILDKLLNKVLIANAGKDCIENYQESIQTYMNLPDEDIFTSSLIINTYVCDKSRKIENFEANYDQLAVKTQNENRAYYTGNNSNYQLGIQIRDKINKYVQNNIPENLRYISTSFGYDFSFFLYYEYVNSKIKLHLYGCGDNSYNIFSKIKSKSISSPVPLNMEELDCSISFELESYLKQDINFSTDLEKNKILDYIAKKYTYKISSCEKNVAFYNSSKIIVLGDLSEITKNISCLYKDFEFLINKKDDNKLILSNFVIKKVNDNTIKGNNCDDFDKDKNERLNLRIKSANFMSKSMFSYDLVILFEYEN